jgi:hypothetical protein
MRKIIFGLAVVAMAATASQFANAKDLTIADRVWVNDGEKYVQMDSADPEANCLKTEAEQCALISTNSSEPIPSTIDYSDVSDFQSLEVHPRSSKGIYNPE